VKFEFTPLRILCKRVLSLDRLQALAYILNKPEVQDEITRLNQENQLSKGLYSDGTNTPIYSASYRKLKASIVSNVGQNMDFRLSGDFYRTFDIEILPNGDVNVTADGQKDDHDLFEKYGIEIIGLTDESKELLVPLFKEFLLEYVSNVLEGTQ